MSGERCSERCPRENTRRIWQVPRYVTAVLVYGICRTHGNTGTWIPLAEGRILAEKHSILERISKIFDYVPGDKSPPPAPKHTTAASNKPKAAKATQRKMPAAQRTAPAASRPSNLTHPAVNHYRPAEVYHPENAYREMSRDATPDSFMQDDSYLPMSQNSTASRKRKRDLEPEPPSDVEHVIYGDELLDYFVVAGDDASSNLLAPIPPENFDVNRPIDTQGNNALHWACAMGDVQVTRDLLSRGANPAAPNHSAHETPLIRAVLFTNNYDKKTFPRVVDLLANTITERDIHGATVFHHIAETGRSRGKWKCARYYCEVLINKMQDMGANYVHALLTSIDARHDTAALCAIRYGCMKVATFLLNHCPEAGDIPNLRGETANDHLRALREKRDSLEQPGSSPPQGNGSFLHKVRRKSNHQSKQTLSRAASSMYDSANSVFESQRDRLADMYDAEAKDKDTNMIEAKAALADFEAQRSRIRQETYAILANPGINENAEDPPHIQALRVEYEAARRETESLVERSEHARLQAEVRAHDEQTPSHLFRAATIANGNTTPSLMENGNLNAPVELSLPELQSSAPWAIDLAHQQARRRQLVRDISGLHGDANSSERINKHRKLVAMATGIKEDDLDPMAGELLASLQANAAEASAAGADDVVRDGRGISLSDGEGDGNSGMDEDMGMSAGRMGGQRRSTPDRRLGAFNTGNAGLGVAGIGTGIEV